MTTEEVIEFLKTRGDYTSAAANSLGLLGMQLSFDAIMIGPGSQDGLLLIERVGDRSLNLLLNKMKALALALERSESARTLTLVLLDCKAGLTGYVELNRLCRLLLLQENDSMEVSLASILPLTLPEPISAVNSADATLKMELDEDYNDPFVVKLLRAARENENEVQKTIRQAIDELSQISTPK
jgi:hypothetical protein